MKICRIELSRRDVPSEYPRARRHWAPHIVIPRVQKESMNAWGIVSFSAAQNSLSLSSRGKLPHPPPQPLPPRLRLRTPNSNPIPQIPQTIISPPRARAHRPLNPLPQPPKLRKSIIPRTPQPNKHLHPNPLIRLMQRGAESPMFAFRDGIEKDFAV